MNTALLASNALDNQVEADQDTIPTYMAHSTLCRCLSVTGFLVSCIFVVFGILGLVIGPSVLQKVVNKQLPLNPESSQLSSWSTPPVPIYLQFWLWECVNVADVLKGARPYMQERGPFTYIEHREKTGVYFNDNHTVTYRQKIAYTFVRNMSVNDESMVIKMVNAPLVTIASMVRNSSSLIQTLLNLIDQGLGENLFVSHTAREWIWGYEDPLLKAAKALPIIGDLVPDDHFGFFYGQNGTDDGLYTVFTGADDINKLNIINKWNGNSSLTYWRTPYGNMINGTDGSWFPPRFQKDLVTERVYLFSTQVCRSLYARYESHSSVRSISTETYSIPAEVFLNATLNPDNAAFGTDDSGVLDVGVCNKGAPIILSLPHLLYAAERYQNQLDGIHPDPAVHRTILQIEPHTGLVLSAKKRLQINVHIQSNQYLDDFRQVRDVILPAIWINESTTIDQKSADDLNGQVLQYFTIVHWLSIVLIVVGGVLFILILVVFSRRNHPKKSSILLNGSANNTLAGNDDD